jgi:hypothetical protein
MASDREQEPIGVAAAIAIVALWFHIGLATLEVLFAAFTPDPGVRFLSFVGGQAYVAVVIGVQRRRHAAVWGVALSALFCGAAFGRGNTVFTSQLLVLIPLLVVATKPREPESHAPRKPRKRNRERPAAVWFPSPMDDPILARTRLPRDWD